MNRPRAGQRRPPWLKVRAGGGPQYVKVLKRLRREGLHTVCESARCPNLGECWGCGTATFMIMGDHCTRNCRFCAVTHGAPLPLDNREPEAVAGSIHAFGLRYAVITSVTRDDLPDGGAAHFAAVISAIRTIASDCRIEVLVPDFQGSESAYLRLLESPPDVLNHNIETVPRLYPHVRPEAAYDRSIQLLQWFASRNLITKSGIMVGLGETEAELTAVMVDLVNAGCDILTIGQYLQPSRDHLPVERFIPPEEFDRYRRIGLDVGFTSVVAGPLVRSSYRAEDAYQAVRDTLDGE
ncbi:lipoyl synthase [bacterium]|nr:lipoyl synthase [candidate division CSSED10-310 bacterium]